MRVIYYRVEHLKKYLWIVRVGDIFRYKIHKTLKSLDNYILGLHFHEKKVCEYPKMRIFVDHIVDQRVVSYC